MPEKIRCLLGNGECPPECPLFEVSKKIQEDLASGQRPTDMEKRAAVIFGDADPKINLTTVARAMELCIKEVPLDDEKATSESDACFLRQQERLVRLIEQERAVMEGRKTTIFGIPEDIYVDGYIVGRAEPWCPNDRLNQQMGWVMYPASNLTSPDLVGLNDVGNVIPQPNDIVISKRVAGPTGMRLSFALIKPE